MDKTDRAAQVFDSNTRSLSKQLAELRKAQKRLQKRFLAVQKELARLPNLKREFQSTIAELDENVRLVTEEGARLTTDRNSIERQLHEASEDMKRVHDQLEAVRNAKQRHRGRKLVRIRRIIGF